MRKTHNFFVLFVMVIALGVAPGASYALNILLTNDDGWDALGIQTMKTALVDAGHNVTLVAPDSNQSGQATAMNFAFPVVTKIQQDTEGKVWSLIAQDKPPWYPGATTVSGTPVMCVLLGRDKILEEEPDLIVSGINDGANTGTGTIFSGTVGAATAGLLSTPSIAISTDLPYEEPENPDEEAANEEHFENVAAFTISLIARLESKPGSLSNESALLPERIGLNVNYPTLPPEDVVGVKVCVQGQVSDRDLAFYAPHPLYPDVFVPTVINNPNPGPDVKDGDNGALADGYITIVPIDGDFTVPNPKGLGIKSWLHHLNP